MIYDGYQRVVTDYESKLPFFVATAGSTEDENFILRPSGIEDFQLIYTYSGCGIIEINGNELRMPENSFIIIPPFIPHHYYSVSDKWTTYWVTYNGFAAEQFSDFKLSVYNMEEREKFLISFIELLKYSRNKDFINESSLLLYKILIDIKLNTSENIAFQKLAAKKMNYIIKYISDNLKKPLQLGTLAALCDMSEGHFCRSFKAYTGKRPMELINEMRINRAKSILSNNSEISTTELSRMVGFDSPSYFIKIFKAKEGITPKKFKETKK